MSSLWLDTRGTATPTDSWEEVIPRTGVLEVVVVGAGLTGLACALQLARAGRRVTVLEARQVGALATGHTTAKLSLLQGSVLSQVRARAGAERLAGYVAAHRAGQEWLAAELASEADGSGTPLLEQRDALTYAATPDGERTVAQELEACQQAGLPVTAVGGDPSVTGLPYPVHAAIRLADQWQLHPVRVLDLLLARLREAGGQVLEGVRVTGVHTGGGGAVRLDTDRGGLAASDVVLATGSPLLDRGGHFAQLEPKRSYAQAHRVPHGTPLPQTMALSVDQPTRSLRTARIDGEDVLVTGGPGHVVGRFSSPALLQEELAGWTATTFPGAELTHRWSAQDYEPVDGMPFVGPVPGTGGRVQLATGFQKWGMTGGTGAAVAIAGRLTGGAPDWAQPLADHPINPQRAVATARLNAQVGGSMTTGWLRGSLSPPQPPMPEEGQGAVGQLSSGPVPGRPVAVSTVDGVTRRVSAVCTHLGGVLRWNDAECTWDCPLHGSRFGPDGTRLEGPAGRDLPRR
ncbi:FAD-dependent oxidoreductase [Ornithinicoccus halotolerans]|uniref:FAD-dependent oxidoreductase n=1 Tax=Ornithinicoccus halotolerans TaxID=1748220 RepID=UPI00129765C3|nr:FAD-dependent oxidoreductase [Ornithinicoccus halotolerans]